MEDLKKIITLLFNDKPLEEQPKKVEFKIRNIITPEEREAFNKWCQEMNVSAMYDAHNRNIG